MEWFFFCPRDRKYLNGSRTNRATRSGYWKATGKDRKIVCETSVSALRKTLVFYHGRAPGGERTDWMMHEYRLCEDLCQGSYNFVGAFALCRVVKRNEHGQRTGEFQREQRIKRAVSSMIDFSSRKDLNILSSSEESPSQAKNLFGPNNESTPTTSPLSGTATEIQSIAIDNNKAGFYGSHGLSNVPQINLLEGEIFSNMTTLKEFSIEMYQPCSLTPVPSYASLTEDSCIVDRLNENGCLSSFPIPIHSIDMYSNEEQRAQHGIEWEPIRFTTPPVNGLDAWNPKVPPAICRQESEGEEVNLWLKEDNMVIVM